MPGCVGIVKESELVPWWAVCQKCDKIVRLIQDGETKQWLPQRFAAVVDRLADGGLRSVLMGGPEERQRVSAELAGIVNIIGLPTLEIIDDIAFLPTGFRKEQVTPVDLLITKDGERAYVALGRANHVAVVDVKSTPDRWQQGIALLRASIQQVTKQEVVIDLTLETDLRRAGSSDRLEDTIDYKAIEQSIVAMAEKSTFFLLERLAQRATEVALTNPAVQRVRVLIEKPAALDNARAAAVEIFRSN